MRPARFPALLAAAVIAIAACGSGASSNASPSASAGASSIAVPAVSGAWARSAPAAGQSAAYFVVSNPAATADALLSASSPAARLTELHETSMDGSGMAGMHPVKRVEVPAGGSVEFKPGSYHLMLMDLPGELASGTTIELDLVFEHAGTVVVRAEVRKG